MVRLRGKAPQAGASAVWRLADGCFGRGEKCGEYKFSGRKSGRFWGKEAFFEGEESPAGGGKRRVAFGSKRV